MADEARHPAFERSRDARAAALAVYLRERAESFSMSADVTGVQDTARAGMALLDAASIAEAMTPSDSRLRVLSERGHFESMPQGRARFVETPAMRAAIQRPLVSDRQTGAEIIAALVSTAREGAPPPTSSPPGLAELSRRVRDTRALVSSLRQEPVGSKVMLDARHRHLEALDDYVTALERMNLPVPQPLQAELRMHRDLFD